MQFLERHFLVADPAVYLDYAHSPPLSPIVIGTPEAPELVLMSYELYSWLRRHANVRQALRVEELDEEDLRAILTASVPPDAGDLPPDPVYPPPPPGIVQLTWLDNDESTERALHSGP